MPSFSLPKVTEKIAWSWFTRSDQFFNFSETEMLVVGTYSKLSIPQFCPQIDKISIFSLEEGNVTVNKQILQRQYLKYET